MKNWKKFLLNNIWKNLKKIKINLIKLDLIELNFNKSIILLFNLIKLNALIVEYCNYILLN